jgi:hypothetical protein
MQVSCALHSVQDAGVQIPCPVQDAGVQIPCPVQDAGVQIPCPVQDAGVMSWRQGKPGLSCQKVGDCAAGPCRSLPGEPTL